MYFLASNVIKFISSKFGCCEPTRISAVVSLAGFLKFKIDFNHACSDVHRDEICGQSMNKCCRVSCS